MYLQPFGSYTYATLPECITEKLIYTSVIADQPLPTIVDMLCISTIFMDMYNNNNNNNNNNDKTKNYYYYGE